MIATQTAFEFFTFSPIGPESALIRFGSERPREYVLQGYKDWIEEFSRRTNVYNVSREYRYEALLYRQFCRSLGVTRVIGEWEHEDDSSQEWSEFIRASDYPQVREASQRALNTCAVFAERYTEGVRLYPNLSGMGVFLGKIDGTIEWPEDVTAWLWEQWFSVATDVSPLDREELCAMPYQDYLKTPYWRRKRAAMLIVHRLRCMSKHCTGLDSWAGGESDLHVHHRHYNTRGREQLADLYLLCADCHRRWHAGEHDLVEYVYDDLLY